jgi:hypothetical protein
VDSSSKRLFDNDRVENSRSFPVGMLRKLDAMSMDILPYLSIAAATATIATQASLVVGGLTFGAPILAATYLAGAAYAVLAKKEPHSTQTAEPQVSHSSSALRGVVQEKAGSVAASIGQISHKTTAFGRELFSSAGLIRAATAVITVGLLASGGLGLPVLATALLACTTLACGSIVGDHVSKLLAKNTSKVSDNARMPEPPNR